MEMMNRAIEDASDFQEMMRKLQQRREVGTIRPQYAHEMEAAQQRKPLPPKRPGENRRDYRARVLSVQGGK